VSLLGFGGSQEAPVLCSSAGCTADAAWRVNWRNPRIHTPDRVKVWLACDAHCEPLSGYLSTRGFPVLVSALDSPVDAVPGSA
jgi:hypothetical protein